MKYWQMTFSLSNLKILCYKIIILATNDSEDHDTFNTLLLDDKTLTCFFLDSVLYLLYILVVQKLTGIGYRNYRLSIS